MPPDRTHRKECTAPPADTRAGPTLAVRWAPADLGLVSFVGSTMPVAVAQRGTSNREDRMTIPSLHHDKSPEAMTRRARWYLGIASSRHLSLGLFCLLAPWLFAAAAFIPILDFLPIWGWGAAMALCGAMCGMSAAIRSGDLARWAMTASATITTVLAAGVWFGVGHVWWMWLAHDTIPAAGTLPSPVVPVLLTALAAKDFVVCAQPIRSPFESVLRQLPGE